jgi:hypothetical protein
MPLFAQRARAVNRLALACESGTRFGDAAAAVWQDRASSFLVREGEPVMESARLVKEVKLGAPPPGLEAPAGDFELKFPLVDLFDRLAEFRDGSIDLIEVRHGLPFRLVVEQRGGAR